MSRSESDIIYLGHDEDFEDLTPVTSAPHYQHRSNIPIMMVQRIHIPGPNIPPPRSGHRMVYSEPTGHLFLVGGYCREDRNEHNEHTHEIIRRDTYIFHTDEMNWRDAMPSGNIPTQLASHYMLAVGQMLLVAGGTSVPFGNIKETRLFSYNTYKSTWRVTNLHGELPRPCYGQTLTHISLKDDEYIYSIGGTTGRFYNMEVHRLRLDDCTWELLPPKKNHINAPFGRYRHETVYYNDRLWVFSGMRYDVPDSLDMRMIAVYNVVKEHWRYMSTSGHVPPFLSCLTATGYKNYVIVTGGYLLTGVVNKHIYLLNLDTREWNIIGLWDEACRFHAAAVVPHRNLLVIFGGMRYLNVNEPSSDAIRFNHTWVFPLCFLPPCSLLELSWAKLVSFTKPIDESKAIKLIELGVPRHLINRYFMLDPQTESEQCSVELNNQMHMSM